MKTLLIILALGISVFAQTTNGHLGGSIEATSGLGYANPIYGATAGADFRKGRLVFSIDADADRVRKNVGGAGYSIAGRETVRFYAHRSFFVQGGAVEQRYSVTDFSKVNVQALVGAGLETTGATKSAVFQFNYRRHVWENSNPAGLPNNSQVAEAVGQFYLRHHIYLRPSFALQWFQSYGTERLVGTSLKLQGGFHF